MVNGCLSFTHVAVAPLWCFPRQGKKRMLSPDRADPFADSTPAPELSTYAAWKLSGVAVAGDSCMFSKKTKGLSNVFRMILSILLTKKWVYHGIHVILYTWCVIRIIV